MNDEAKKGATGAMTRNSGNGFPHPSAGGAALSHASRLHFFLNFADKVLECSGRNGSGEKMMSCAKMKKTGSLLLALLPLLNSCKNGVPNTKTSSVTLPTSSYHSQGRIPMCWAAAAANLIESEVLSRSKKEIRLSVEAIVFPVLAQSFFEIYQDAAKQIQDGVPQNVVENELGEIFKSFNPRTGKFTAAKAWSGVRAEGNLLMPGILSKEFGLVPESAWKDGAGAFDSEQNAIRTAVRMQQGFYRLLRERKGAEVTLQEMMDAVGKAGFGVIPPYQSFVYEGQRYTGSEFATQVMGFVPEQYSFVSAKDAATADRLIELIKRVLAARHGIVVGFSADQSLLEPKHKHRFLAPQPPAAIDLSFGHAAFITDFVNKGGKAGELPLDQLKAEVEKPASELDALVIKNSRPLSDEKVSSANDLNYELEYGFLQASAGQDFFEVLVPEVHARCAHEGKSLYGQCIPYSTAVSQ